jgi:hypothetical protein
MDFDAAESAATDVAASDATLMAERPTSNE